jgi:hypothetical protein
MDLWFAEAGGGIGPITTGLPNDVIFVDGFD